MTSQCPNLFLAGEWNKSANHLRIFTSIWLKPVMFYSRTCEIAYVLHRYHRLKKKVWDCLIDVFLLSVYAILDDAVFCLRSLLQRLSHTIFVFQFPAQPALQYTRSPVSFTEYNFCVKIGLQICS